MRLYYKAKYYNYLTADKLMTMHKKKKTMKGNLVKGQKVTHSMNQYKDKPIFYNFSMEQIMHASVS